MEAMACGCATIASRVGGNPELIADGETGLLFERDDVGGLAERLALLIENDALRRRLGDAGARFIRDRYSLQASTARMQRIYESSLRAASHASR
jgi:glycosyltransferase involved in cell wall biosynthesis